ncbi:MAG: hypothetical protein CM1200mP9_03550 [Gammaproteobacteria bacterium]|nr:MAG: hypothetical protein CM1200mP9_03550 [Gammaproteobacteria bacterium]
MSTLHTNSAVGAVTRLVDMGIEPFLLRRVWLAYFRNDLGRVLCPGVQAGSCC